MPLTREVTGSDISYKGGHSVCASCGSF